MKPNDIDRLFVDQPDAWQFEVSRSLFTDQELFDLEMKHIVRGHLDFPVPRKPGGQAERLFPHPHWAVSRSSSRAMPTAPCMLS